MIKIHSSSAFIIQSQRTTITQSLHQKPGPGPGPEPQGPGGGGGGLPKIGPQQVSKRQQQQRQ